MRKNSLLIINAALIAPFLIFFKLGGSVAAYMLTVWLIMSVINTVFSKNIKQLILYNGSLMLFGALGILICGQLYFHFVTFDSLGETILYIELIAEIIFISVLTVIEALIKYFVGKKN